MLYHILLTIDGLAALVALGFFTAGLADGTVSDFNISTWLLLLIGVCSFPIGGVALRSYGKPAPPTACSSPSPFPLPV